MDYFHLQGMLRWSLILLFMMLKAGLIVAVFMHMAWERLALAYAILLPPVLVLVFVALMVFEADYTLVHPGDVLRCRAELTSGPTPAPTRRSPRSATGRSSSWASCSASSRRSLAAYLLGWLDRAGALS